MSTTTVNLDDYERSLVRSGKSANTIRIYSNVVRQFLDTGHDDPLEWIIESRESGASASTLKARSAALKNWSDYRGDAGARVALDGHRLPTVQPPAPHPVPGGVGLVRAVLGTVSDRRVRCLIGLGAFGGLRVSESLSVTPLNWDRSANVLVIKGKGGKTRNVPVSASLAEILIESAPSDPRQKYVGLQDRWARVKITEAFDNFGIKHLSGKSIASHDLRATFATEVYSKNQDVIMVQRLLGHADVKTTQQYLGLSSGQMHDAVDF